MRLSKKEYESLLFRIARLEYAQDEYTKDFALMTKRLREEMDNYFKHKCEAIIIKRDKNMVVGEVRDKIMNNLFKEDI